MRFLFDYTLPFSFVFSLLILALFPIWRFCRKLIEKNFNDLDLVVLAPGIMTSLIVILTHVFSYLLKDFIIGCSLAIILLAIISQYNLSKEVACYRIFNIRHKIAILFATILIAPALFLFDFHDKLVSYSGHFSITSQILNNIYPPKDIFFPSFNLNYHFGIDTLYAIFIFLTHFNIDLGIDLVTLLLFVYSLFLYSTLGKKLFNNSYILILFGLFSAGLPFIAGFENNLSLALLSIIEINKSYLNPPLISYFFQPPWTLGIPISIIIFLIVIYLENNKITNKIALLLFLAIVCLGITNTTLFLAITSSLGLVSLFKLFFSKEKNQAFILGIIICFGIFSGLLLSGFTNVLLKLPPVTEGGVVLDTNGIANDFLANLKWNLATFGLILPIGLVGVFYLSKARILMLLIILQGLIVVNLFRYERSWDIVKFATLSQFILAICAGALITNLFSKSRLISYVLCLFTVIYGLLFPSVFLFNLKPNPFAKKIWQDKKFTRFNNQDEINTITYLRNKIKAGEMILANQNRSFFYTFVGGFPQFWMDSVSYALGFSSKILEDRSRLSSLNAPVSLYKKEGLKWIIVDSDDLQIINFINNNLSSGEIINVENFNNIKIYEILNTK